MDLLDGSKYRIQRTRANLFGVMLEHFQMKEKVVASKLKGCGFQKFDPAEWDKYIFCLTNRPPCMFCSAPTKHSDHIVINKYYGDLVCVQEKMHYHLQFHQDLIINREMKNKGMPITRNEYDVLMHIHFCKEFGLATLEFDTEKFDLFEAEFVKANNFVKRECEHHDMAACCPKCFSIKVNKNFL